MVSDILTKSVSVQVHETLIGWLTGTAKMPYEFKRPKIFK